MFKSVFAAMILMSIAACASNSTEKKLGKMHIEGDIYVDVDTIYIDESYNKLTIDPFSYESYSGKGAREVLAKCDGNSVAISTDSLTGITAIWLGDEMMAWHPKLSLTGIDKNTGKATFAIGLQTIDVDLTNSDDLARLKSFIEPQPGQCREGYRFGLRYCGESGDVKDMEECIIIVDGVQGSRESAACMKPLYDGFLRESHTFSWLIDVLDTCYYIKQTPQTIRDYAVDAALIKQARYKFENTTNVKVGEFDKDSEHNSFFMIYHRPTFINGKYITWENSYRYSSSSFPYDYFTTKSYDLASGKEIELDDLIRPEMKEKAIELFVDRIAKLVPDENIFFDFEPTPEGKKEIVAEYALTENENGTVTYNFIPALDRDGLIVGYDNYDISLSNANDVTYLKLSWDEAKQLIKPEVLSAMGIR